MQPLTVHIWSDLACPWCYVGKRHLETALKALPKNVTVASDWHAFELDPSAPKATDPAVSYLERLAKKYRVAPEQAQAMVDRMVRTGEAVGIRFDFEHIQPGNTFDAHRLLQFAKTCGLADELKEALLRAYHCQGVRISDKEELVRLAGEVGLDVDKAAAVLQSEDFADDVRQDEAVASSLGVGGVPFFVIGRYGVSGAQPPPFLQEVLARALRDASEDAEPEPEEGAVCHPEQC